MSRPAASTSSRSGAIPSSRTALTAITFVLPGLDPMPSRASRPGLLEVVVQLELLTRQPVEAAQVDVVTARLQARMHRGEVDAVARRVHEHVAVLELCSESGARVGRSHLRTGPPVLAGNGLRALLVDI